LDAGERDIHKRDDGSVIETFFSVVVSVEGNSRSQRLVADH
jgi:hypothetical protein